jgi:phosphoglycolate phosphatase
MRGRFSLVLFDLDGVVVDSAAAMGRAVDAALESVGVGPAPPEKQRLLFGPPLYLGFAALLGAMGADPALNKRCAALYRESYRDFVIAESRIYDGMQGVLEHLLPLMAMAVATSKPHEVAQLLLRSLALDEYFTKVVAPQSEAEEEAKAITIARALEDQRELETAVHVGDTAEDVIAARANNIACAAALWGFGTEQELREAGATWLVRAPRDLTSVLCCA